jgi:hypothetical protein
MADVNFSGSVGEALTHLGEQVLEARTWSSISLDLIGDGPDAPEWPYLLSRQIDRIHHAFEQLSDLVHAARLGSSQ